MSRRSSRLLVRAALPGEGGQIAALWRELWDAHEEWGGYAGTRDQRIYDQIGQRLDQDARRRDGHPVFGRHVHLVAVWEGRLVGQVEGWLERHGVDDSTPNTCEVRSLIVRAADRQVGAGRALLAELGRTARIVSGATPLVLAAEVLELNPAQTFYAKLGYVPVSWTLRISTERALSSPEGPARVAEPRDALAIALLEATLAARRRASGDVRFDRPRAVDATLIGAIAAHLSSAAAGGEFGELVATDATGQVRASCTLFTTTLDPPFLHARRAILGRFAVDPALDPFPLVQPLIALGTRLAHKAGASVLELTDFSAPETALFQSALASGASPWSRVVLRTLHEAPGPAIGR